MGVLLKPNIKVDDIIIEADTDNEYNVNRIMNEWGRAIPLVKINDYVCNIGEVIECHVKVEMGELPSFQIEVIDDSYKIREALKKEIDTCVIFFGFKNWYVKFNGIINEINSDSGDYHLFINGTFYNEPLYFNKQKLWKETSVIDIIKNVCTDTNMGLYTIDNTELTFVPDVVIQTENNLKFIQQMIQRYTNNIFCYDTYGYLHVGDIESIKKQPFDQFTISPKTGEQIKPTDIIFRTRKITDYPEENTEVEDNKIPVEHYTICNNFSLTKINNASSYKIVFDDGTFEELPSNNEIGTDVSSENTFIGFSKHKKPFHVNRVNKMLSGSLIKLNLRQIVYELTPFSIVNLELNLPSSAMQGKPQHLDEEHSGKHIVIGYSYDYEKQLDATQNHIEQNIILI